MKLRLFIFLTLCYVCGPLCSQNAESFNKEGLSFFTAKKYGSALSSFLSYERAKPASAETLSLIGICYYYTNRLDAAETYLQKAITTKASPPPDAYLYLAKIYHATLQFEDAVRLYKAFLKNTGQNHPLRRAVKDDIRRCATGMKVRRLGQVGAVVNLGDEVNTAEDDFKPLFSPGDQRRIYFSSSRKGNAGCGDEGPCPADIYYVEMMDGDWAAPKPYSVFVNSIEHEIAIGFNSKGTSLFFQRGKNPDTGQILVDTLRENSLEGTLFFDEPDNPLRPQLGDTAPFFFSDSVLLFASRRNGGFGGLDLYVSIRQSGRWSEPENLGPNINSIYDETSPFLAPDGNTLYFSTNDVHRSIGGLDILKSIYLDNVGKWMVPKNLGAPINSAADDTHFILKPDGKQALFSSARKTGNGGYDLYVAIFYEAQELVNNASSFPFFRVSDRQAPANQRPIIVEEEDIFEKGWPLVFRPVYYLNEKGSPIKPEDTGQLQRLSQLLKKFPQTKAIIAIHCDPSDPMPDACEGALAQTLQQLWENEAPVENVLLRQAGATFPISDTHPPANRRIEIYIPNVEEIPYDIRFQEPALAAAPGNFFRSVMSTLSYRVQIPFTDQASLEALCQRHQNGMIDESPLSGKPVFTIGLYLTFSAAEETRKQQTLNGYPTAKVKAYLNGWEISKEEAANLIKAYPDLKDFARQ